ncbi:MAG: DEAD/DEAH box helicase [Bacteroidetes bacterium]|nr:DEAD/DEAH box helicase [Bacteroidota bacterium]
MSFEELNLSKPLFNAISDIGFTSPTPIQEKAFPIVLSGRDVIGIDQTGTGKTIAYLLPILRELKFSVQKNARVLIVVPTRELVMQVVGEIEKLTKYMNVRTIPIYGGTNIKSQKDISVEGQDIIVATPGRLIDLVLSGVVRLKTIQKFVIDEVDEMLNLGFRIQLVNIMELLPVKRQNLMFSATLTPDVDKLISDFFYNPIKIEINPHGTPLDNITQKGYHAPNFITKSNLLEYLFKSDQNLSKVLIFVGSRKASDRLYEFMKEKFPSQFGVIHSNKTQNYRFKALKKFQENTYRGLIATDIAARGLDISDVTHVINFNTPEIPGDYMHRIGRTGRATKEGTAITLINEAEKSHIIEIEDLIKMKIPIEPLPEEVEVSDIFSDEEKPDPSDKNYLKTVTPKVAKGAFHEKSALNKKTNQGGAYRKFAKQKANKTKSRLRNKK